MTVQLLDHDEGLMQSAWNEPVQKVLAEGARRVFVMGAVDVGKSSLCLALIRAATECGLGASLLDSDVGQKLVGPPAAVTCSEPGRPHALASLSFVGATDPVRGFAAVIRGTGELASRCKSDLVVVNTSGLVASIGIRLKTEKIRAACPDLIIAIGDHPAISAILSHHPGVRVIRPGKPPDAKRKTDGQRRAARREAFRAYFEASEMWDMPATAIEPKGASLSAGQLVGLRDADGRELGMGLAVDSLPDSFRVLAPHQGKPAVVVAPGQMVLDNNYEATLIASRSDRLAWR